MPKYTIDLPKKQVERLDELTKRMECTKAEFVRAAIRVLDAIVREADLREENVKVEVSSPDKPAVQIVPNIDM